MDPATILAIVNGSLDLAIKCASVVKNLNDLASKYKQAELVVLAIAEECHIIQFAWDRIEIWARQQDSSVTSVDSQVVERLDSSLRIGKMVLSALDHDLLQLGSASEKVGFRQRRNLIWNEQRFRDHQDRIRGQVLAMTLLLEVIKLTSSAEQSDLLTRGAHVLQAASESALTIINSQAPTSVRFRDADSLLSDESTDLVYRRLSFEDALFTARVYKRNFRNNKINQLFRNSPKAEAEPVIDFILLSCKVSEECTAGAKDESGIDSTQLVEIGALSNDEMNGNIKSADDDIEAQTVFNFIQTDSAGPVKQWRPHLHNVKVESIRNSTRSNEAMREAEAGMIVDSSFRAEAGQETEF